MAHLREHGVRLLQEVEHKEAVLEYIVTVGERRKVYRKQASSMLTMLLQDQQWLIVASEARQLRDRLPPEVKPLLDALGEPEEAFGDNAEDETASVVFDANQEPQGRRASTW